MQKPLPPPPIRSPADAKIWVDWYTHLQDRVTEDVQLMWSQTDKTNSDLADLETKAHASLDSIGVVDETDTNATLDKHTSNAISKLNKDHRDKTNLNAHGNTIDASITFDDATNITFNSTTGTEIGTAITEKLGFWGSTPVVQPTALSVALTPITHTAPGTPDYAIQDLVDSGVGSTWGFATQDEGNTVLKVILNLQTRINELETKLQAVGIIA